MDTKACKRRKRAEEQRERERACAIAQACTDAGMASFISHFLRSGISDEYIATQLQAAAAIDAAAKAVGLGSGDAALPRA